ncbi:MAG: DUF2202 domain-containing protein [Hydrogenophaga sp.]|nr:DUF2202 domain-containing protein [Hydrogenophaga sp.]
MPLSTRLPSRLSTLGLSLMAAALVSLTACGGGSSDAPAYGNSAMSTNLSQMPVEALSAAEAQSLTFMREEEKLAGDVYTRLATVWGSQVRVFDNIAVSEDAHTEAIRQLLERYALPDPSASTGEGQYVNADLQALYGQLVASGSNSLDDALRVGLTIEELDIRDIQVALQGIDNADIRTVYENLLSGSRNHLRAFYAVLTQRGGSYTPQYISEADFLAIVNGA